MIVWYYGQMLIQKLTTLSYKKTKKPYNTKLNKNLEEKMKLKLKLKKNIILPKFYLIWIYFIFGF